MMRLMAGVSHEEVPTIRIMEVHSYHKIHKYRTANSLDLEGIQQFINDFLEKKLKPYQKHELDFWKLTDIQRPHPTLVNRRNVENHTFILILGDTDCEKSREALGEFVGWKNRLASQSEFKFDFFADSILSLEVDKLSHDQYPFLIYLEPGKKKKKTHTYLWSPSEFESMVMDL